MHVTCILTVYGCYGTDIDCIRPRACTYIPPFILLCISITYMLMWGPMAT